MEWAGTTELVSPDAEAGQHAVDSLANFAIHSNICEALPKAGQQFLSSTTGPSPVATGGAPAPVHAELLHATAGHGRALTCLQQVSTLSP